jgi:hypothetical protein
MCPSQQFPAMQLSAELSHPIGTEPDAALESDCPDFGIDIPIPNKEQRMPQQFVKISDKLSSQPLAALATKLRLPKSEVTKIAIAALWSEVVGK